MSDSGIEPLGPQDARTQESSALPVRSQYPQPVELTPSLLLEIFYKPDVNKYIGFFML